ncbi:abc transporter [Lasius niger]|uniref:Abc transporter n=1 Tax=Lasius niger TaxID=67767 RepID=A0A0J7KV76_LASNI|nr:abc transporter [Lasius niger]
MSRELFEEIRKQFVRLPIVNLEEHQALGEETRIFVYSEDEPLSERTISQLMESHLSRRTNLAITRREAKIKAVIGEMIAESKKEGIFDEKAIDDYSFEVITIENKGGQSTASLTEKYQLPEDKRI